MNKLNVHKFRVVFFSDLGLVFDEIPGMNNKFTYGDASFTLIDPAEFINVLESAIPEVSESQKESFQKAIDQLSEVDGDNWFVALDG